MHRIPAFKNGNIPNTTATRHIACGDVLKDDTGFYSKVIISAIVLKRSKDRRIIAIYKDIDNEYYLGFTE